MEKDFYMTLIYKELKGEISPQDEVLLKEFLKKSSENEDLYTDIRLTWELSELSLNINDLDVEADLNNLKKRMPKKEAKVISFRRRFLQIAAAIVFLAAAGFLFRNLNSPSAIELFAQNANLDFELSDGTKGTLRQGSKLTYQSTFSENRISSLSGTAQFDVAHDAAHPFKINIKETVVEVLGTEFMIAHSEGQERITVSVNSGRVSFSQNNESIILTKGEVGICQSKTSTPEKVETSVNNFLYWKKNQFRFDGERLKSVVEQLEVIYNIGIEISNPSMENCELLGVFNGDNPEKTLSDIANKFKMTLVLVSENSYRLDEGICK